MALRFIEIRTLLIIQQKNLKRFYLDLESMDFGFLEIKQLKMIGHQQQVKI